MAYRFKTGDQIRIAHTAGSTWQDRRGTVEDVIVRYANKPVQECAVNLGGERRWFLEEHLTRSILSKWVRFFRSEVIERWKLDAEVAATITGDMDQLIEVLCSELHFTIPRAQLEVEKLYDDFDKMIPASASWQAGEMVEVPSTEIKKAANASTAA